MENSDNTDTFPTDIKDKDGKLKVWDTKSIQESLSLQNNEAGLKSAERAIVASGKVPKSLATDNIEDEHGRDAIQSVLAQVLANAKSKRQLTLVLQLHKIDNNHWTLFFNDLRMGRRWIYGEGESLTVTFLEQVIEAVIEHCGKDIVIIPCGDIVETCRLLVRKAKTNKAVTTKTGSAIIALEIYAAGLIEIELSANHYTPPKKSAY